jgi:Protein of unknown function (DUF2939)
MRWAARTSLVFLILVAVYTVWPFIDLYRLGTAIERRDVAGLSQRVELRALHASINRQVVAAYLRLTGKEASLGRLGSDVAVGLAASIVPPTVDEHASTARFLELLAEGWPRDAFAGSSKRIALMPRTFGTVWRLYANSEYSLDNFYVSVPVAVPPPQRFRLRLRLTQWTWKLSEVQLPDELRLRLANELIKSAGKN